MLGVLLASPPYFYGTLSPSYHVVLDLRATPARRRQSRPHKTIFDAALRKTFHTLLFDYLPDFLASETASRDQSLEEISWRLDEAQGGHEGGASPTVGGGGSGDGATADSTPRSSPMLSKVWVWVRL